MLVQLELALELGQFEVVPQQFLSGRGRGRFQFYIQQSFDWLVVRRNNEFVVLLNFWVGGEAHICFKELLK